VTWPKGQSGNPTGKPRGATSRKLAGLREALQLVYENRMKDLDRWLGETADGWKIKSRCPHCKEEITIVGEKDPGKAAQILCQLHDHFVPKLRPIDIDLTQIPIEDISAELARREALEQAAPLVQ